jgi:hypothetical protein
MPIYTGLFLSFLALAASAEQVTCQVNSPIEGGGSVVSTLKLTLQRKRAIGIAIDVTESHVVSTGNPMAIWTGGLDTMETSSIGSQQWTLSGNTVVARIWDPGSQTQDTVIRISRRKTGFEVSFDKISGYFRGMARFPKSMVMTRDGSHCEASFADP